MNSNECVAKLEGFPLTSHFSQITLVRPRIQRVRHSDFDLEDRSNYWSQVKVEFSLSINI